MLPNQSRDQKPRRGIVLILIVAMLGLLFVIGVMFAMSSGQYLTGSKKYSQGLSQPSSSELMDFALSRLINDTHDPLCAIRGHSLLRDMYGNDAANNGYLNFLPDGSALQLVGTPAADTVPGYTNFMRWQTNIPATGSPALYGLNFTRWLLRLPPALPGYPVAQTLEVLRDDATSGVHYLTLSNNDPWTTVDPNGFTPATLPSPGTMSQPAAGMTFALDGRFLHAFNGPGATVFGQLANFRLTPFSPNAVGLDEDYDAPDLENWFLGLQSADQSANGGVVIPSFHRPGILTAADWGGPPSAKILRPRAIDHPASGNTFPDLIPGANGKITYDVDNDGDGVTDAVWLDLGHPILRSATGKMYKPLYAMTVLGLNGRLPLNTAGNIQGRNLIDEPVIAPATPSYRAGDPTFDHTSHLGYSVNEINPKFALQNAPVAGFGQVDNANVGVDVTQLRNLLTGTRPQNNPYTLAGTTNADSNFVTMGVYPSYYMPNNLPDAGDLTSPPTRAVPPVAGRWGEADDVPMVLNSSPFGAPVAFNNYVRPGRSNLLLSASGNWDFLDGADDDFDALDFFPAGAAETGDLYDSTGSLMLPSERIRRFLTPIDPSGNGRAMTWRVQPYVVPPAGVTPGASYLNGFGPDSHGRLSYYQYMRPAGLPTKWDYSVSPPRLITPTPAPDLSNNVFHGFASFQDPPNSGQPIVSSIDPPGPPPAPANVASFMAARPRNSGTLPTFGLSINATIDPANPGSPPAYPNVANGFPNGSMNWDEADEMNPYNPSRYDAPFGPHDLEWLYRKQDVDGGSLDSRLSRLAPISFLNPWDALTRRRLFSTEVFDTTNFAWANDNPGNAFPLNSSMNNQTWGPGVPPYAGGPQSPNATSSLYYIQNNTGPVPNVIETPSLAHRDRKINLNFPLPVSNDPHEPVRQKWIRETYQMLKLVLPPQSVDTPEELAALSQFVINIVDFRDPDSTTTRFVNTDLVVLPATSTTYSKVVFPGSVPAPLTAPATPPYPYDPALDPSPPPAPPATPAPVFLVQSGMEYNPIAINEVLAYTFNRKPAIATPRMFVELVNTLTRDAGGTASNLDPTTELAGWDLVRMDDTPLGRPDPVTGQIPLGALPVSASNSVLFVAPAAAPPPPPAPAPPSGLAPPPGGGTTLPPILSLTNGGAPAPAAGTPGPPPTPNTNYYYVLGNAAPPAVGGSPSEVGPTFPPAGPAPSGNSYQPLINATIPDNTLIPSPPTSNTYYWLYLRRPSNPFDPNSPKVVVDSFRFPFVVSDGVGGPVGMPPRDGVATAPRQEIYSSQRLQPYRGGHSVARPTGSPVDPSPPAPFGFSEQTAPPTDTSSPPPPPPPPGMPPPTFTSFYGAWGTVGITKSIIHTLGKANNPAETTGWSHLPFHDRDFMSVAELLLVPGCPPGLFTKQFVERRPPLPAPSAGPYATPPPGKPGNVPTAFAAGTPPVFPYLNDEFFYTAQSAPLPAAPATPPIGGTTGAGWHKMLEFFDVPSSALGSIGTVASGQNFDWLRQDLKPGQINLNLIIDEEVFFGLIDDSRLNLAQLPVGSPLVPRIVTQSVPLMSYSMPNRGFLQVDPVTSTTTSRMKAAFADFLKLRHGGSVFLFAHGNGAVNQPVTTGLDVPTDRFYHSLSYPDIDYTVMRPATLPPSTFTTPAKADPTGPPAAPPPTPSPWVRDPGLKNPDLSTVVIPPAPAIPQPQPPPTPARRLFEIADWAGGTPAGSNASETGDPNVNNVIAHPNLANTNAYLFSTTPVVYPTIPPDPNPPYLGADSDPGTPPAPPAPGRPPRTDNREHPYFRTEMLQKVMNLSTVRTHQYAVWITVGLFEVAQPGNPQMGVPDQLGPEVDASSGRNVRYRSFFILDRTRAAGYDPADPADFRNVVIYRRLIE